MSVIVLRLPPGVMGVPEVQFDLSLAGVVKCKMFPKHKDTNITPLFALLESMVSLRLRTSRVSVLVHELYV